ncbi:MULTISPECIES: DUF4149 domain-containing protein [unclassified Thiomonas]|uniref:DUF4149 domain-containing protein n=1 Tax=unclassified Thiomonas TaxID=2625466 RepID=UPI0004DBA0C1|nr:MULTISPECIES: DUF4149 domain-containing protein [unclassified Thiomonas]CDW95998.1 conserved membrane hypothetical protein [Thiomonas sp. CB2]VDY07013.1 conserved membrane protein of unknown function [Thiomonas sp. Bio17B3]VDY09691.1 conserved membrane protein of unknown function [Thiomonas sp. Sup16B3]VDY15287.1 conserved hypothetical protein; putative exported protein [Thiomonas sp. OC7]VDY15539.1 conserved membrane protein of unknown function [Thiomonas sp. CB2]
MSSLRTRWFLAALWLGGMVAVGLIGAPTAFATVPEKMIAAAVASRMFYFMALAAIVFGVLIAALERFADKRTMSADLLLPLGGVSFAVLGEFGVVPRLLQAAYSHSPQAGMWHGIASLVFALQALCVAAYVWRLPTRRKTA